jgi:hypothetical protein
MGETGWARENSGRGKNVVRVGRSDKGTREAPATRNGQPSAEALPPVARAPEVQWRATHIDRTSVRVAGDAEDDTDARDVRVVVADALAVFVAVDVRVDVFVGGDVRVLVDEGVSAGDTPRKNDAARNRRRDKERAAMLLSTEDDEEVTSVGCVGRYEVAH